MVALSLSPSLSLLQTSQRPAPVLCRFGSMWQVLWPREVQHGEEADGACPRTDVSVLLEKALQQFREDLVLELQHIRHDITKDFAGLREDLLKNFPHKQDTHDQLGDETDVPMNISDITDASSMQQICQDAQMEWTMEAEKEDAVRSQAKVLEFHMDVDDEEAWGDLGPNVVPTPFDVTISKQEQ
ncbi:unnamed protein product [Symbiodinium natans]|uniref:Uncharacterized protein n=1 Tax=Symbiodinium natans TaxID=878477 RepID=A0A812KG42_9DINO|nr:unnamed protein product [Symbiodinium natans]